MKLFFSFALMSCVVFSNYAQKTFNYPETPKDTFVDVYFNDNVEDPYQWMENSNDPRLAEWLASQKKLTNKQHKKYVSMWTLRSQLSTMYNKTKAKNKKTYQKKADSLKSKYQFKYVRTSSKRASDLMFRRRGDKNYKKLVNLKDFRLDKDDNVSITNRYINEEYNLVGIEFSHNGSDWREVYFFDLLTGERLSDKLENLRGYGLIWDKRDVIYNTFERPEKGRELLDKPKGQKLFYHILGNKQSEDTMLYQNPDVTGTNSFHYFKLGDKVFFKHYYTVRGQTVKALSVAFIKPNSFYLSNFLLYPNADNIYVEIEELHEDTVYLKTNWQAENGRVLKADITQLNKVSEFIPEYDSRLIEVNKLGKGKMACMYANEGKNLAMIFDLEGQLLRTIDFPEGKKIHGLYEKEDNATHTNFSVSSFFHPELWYQLSLSDLTFKPAQVLTVPYDAESLETRYVKYTSKDGTEVPMYITCAKDTKLDGNNPTLIYGYGGYGTTVRPFFDESSTLWLLHGGILAVPNVRGGGANGTDWSLDGRRLKKQNTIDDFIGAAEFLISENYTSSEKLAINGTSHGGLVVGAALTQRPELFKAAIAESGPYDMLRFEQFTVGSANTNVNEFGTVTDTLDYVNLKSYSPLHNIKKGVKYPNVLLIVGENDDRVPPFHSYKFLANLQEKGSEESLYEIYVVEGTGHGGALNDHDFTQKITHKYAFLFSQLGLKIE
ncbi:prolyl oligopeptidase family serine peptidase [Winogradskyella sediminis]|uniref:prolyl oligopeptidase n=1 Tax=Winogradskyella sediminis TaxID=1382466 RepID=A0A1H1N2Q6_9FLAO|nr:prolyl oligopeptidase family serine peptidase [Winogradskyella sediminis]REG87390.1 prolyl oligopeptidase [Winogradskyella sediminis]SDR92469.1 prolyl oligopeptidase [Winogradskyella sediminis]